MGEHTLAARGNAPDVTSKFKQCVTCTCSGAGGILLGHAGCVAAASGTMIGLAGAGGTMASIGIGAAGMAAGLYAWWKLGGHSAPRGTKIFVMGSALTGFALMNAFHAAGGHSGHDHPAGTARAQAWYEGLSPETREQIAANAARQKISLSDYIAQICGADDAPPAPKP